MLQKIFVDWFVLECRSVCNLFLCKPVDTYNKLLSLYTKKVECSRTFNKIMTLTRYSNTLDNTSNTPLTLILFLILVELLYEDGYYYKLFSTNCFWISGILLRVCSAYSGSTIQGQGQDLQKASFYKHIPIVDSLLEDKLNIVISKWKIVNSEFMNSNVSKSLAQMLYCTNFFHLSRRRNDPSLTLCTDTQPTSVMTW